MPGPHSHATITGDRRVKQLLSEMVDRVTGMQVAWPGVGAVIADAMDKQFDTFGAHLNGRPWAPLSPPYLAWKIRNGFDPRTLRKTGDMRASLVSRPMAVERYGDFEATFGTNDEKARFHQNGTRFMPQRKIMNATADLADDVNSVLARYIFEDRLV